MPDKPSVKCADCGFLALLNPTDDTLSSAGPFYRTIFVEPNLLDWCFMDKRNFILDMDKLKREYAAVETLISQLGPDAAMEPYISVQRVLKGPGNPPLSRAQREVMLTTAINCEEFVRYRSGLGPKEHREMLDRQWQLDREHEWRLEEQAANKALADTNRETVDIARKAAASTKFAAWMQAASVFVAAVAIVVSVVVSTQCSDNKPNVTVPVNIQLPQATPGSTP